MIFVLYPIVCGPYAPVNVKVRVCPFKRMLCSTNYYISWYLYRAYRFK